MANEHPLTWPVTGKGGVNGGLVTVAQGSNHYDMHSHFCSGGTGKFITDSSKIPLVANPSAKGRGDHI